MAITPHIFTHSSFGVSHSATQVNQSSDQRFYPISTAFRRGYYYYLYIYTNHVSKRTASTLDFHYYKIPIRI